MKRVVIAILIVLVVGLVSCGACASGASSKKSSTTPSASQATAPSANSSTLPDRAGFDEATNQAVDVQGVEFSLPSYYVQGEKHDDRIEFSGSDANGNKEYVYVYCMNNPSVKAASVEKFQSSKSSVVSSMFGGNVYKDVKNTGSADGGVADLPSGVYTHSGKLVNNGKEIGFTARTAIFLTPNLQVGAVLFIQCDSVKNDYRPDFEKVLASAKVLQQESGDQAPAEQSADGVSPSLKEALDSYEAFMDEYIEFMQKYKDSGDTASMMNDYLSYLQKYSDLVGKINAMDTKNMSNADAAYYLEVTARVSQKLLNAAV